MVLKNKRIGVAMTGSFCTYTKAFEQIDRLLEEGAILQTIFSDISQHIKCRFGKGEEFVKRAHDMTGNEPMKTIDKDTAKSFFIIRFSLCIRSCITVFIIQPIFQSLEKLS